MEKKLMTKWKAASLRVRKLQKQAEPIIFSRFGNDPAKSLAIPANMKKAKMLVRKARQNLRLMSGCIKKLKVQEQQQIINH